MLFASKGYALCDARAQYSSLSSERRIFELCDLTLCYQREMADRVSTESSMPATVVVPDEGGVAEPEVGIRAADGPTPKAPGPSPPRPENPEIENLVRNTVHGVLLGSEDLVSVPLDTLQRLQMSRVEASESLIRTLSYEVAKSEAERWRKAANTVLEGLYKLQNDVDWLQREHSSNPSQDLDSMVLPADRGIHAGKATPELRILIQASNLRYSALREGAGFWGHTYFEQLLQPESDLAALSDYQGLAQKAD